MENLLGRQAAQDLDLEALEMAVRQRVLSLAGSFLERWLNRDTSDYAGPHLACSCHAEARYAGRHRKRFRSVLGDLELQRAYYHCSCCGRGFCPRDRQLGLENTSVSPAVTRMIASVAALVSFQESAELLNELAGVPVDAKQVERTAETLGTEIGEDERHNLEPSNHLDLPRTLYLGMDGTGIPMRSQELAGRAGKQPDGCTSTGVVEAGCKVAIGTRLKRSGMHWTLYGSNAIIALRCCRLSGRFQDFWERRSEARAA